MKSVIYSFIIAAVVSSCTSSLNNSVVSQRYIHKYGFDVSKNEWNDRESDGKVVTLLENGVKVTESFENGILHGPSSYTFPQSNIPEKIAIYDQGTLMKEVINDKKGVPIQEVAYEFDNRKVVTFWDQNGAPLSVEEYENDSLVEASYYNSLGEVESTIENGTGLRVKRDRMGKLLLKDQMEKSNLVQRITFHPNGEIESISQFDNYLLHGEQKIFTPNGDLNLIAQWDKGTLNGHKICYRDGIPFLEIPYVNGKKNGVEKRYDDEGKLISETAYMDDMKHGPSIAYKGKETKTDWFYKDRPMVPPTINSNAPVEDTSFIAEMEHAEQDSRIE